MELMFTDEELTNSVIGVYHFLNGFHRLRTERKRKGPGDDIPV